MSDAPVTGHGLAATPAQAAIGSGPVVVGVEATPQAEDAVALAGGLAKLLAAPGVVVSSYELSAFSGRRIAVGHR